MSKARKFKCPKCEDEFKHVPKFLRHLKSSHDLVVTDSDAFYIETYHNGIHPLCECSPGCQDKRRFYGWKEGFPCKFARGHNAVLDSIYLNKEFQKQSVQKRLDGFAAGKYQVWNKDKTRETDTRVAAMSDKISDTLQKGYESGRISDWRIDNLEKATAAAKKISNTKLERFASGKLVIWSKGLTKETDPRLVNLSEGIKAAYDANPTNWRRTLPDEINDRINFAIKDKFISLHDQNYHYSVRSEFFKVKCLKCNEISEKTLHQLEKESRCFHCIPKWSKAQGEIYDLVKQYFPDAIINDRKQIAPQELDIFIPSKNFAIEYNGLYWHSTVYKDKKYHQNKLNATTAAGISLFMIYEDEWKYKRSIVEAMLKHRLGIHTARVSARKCSIRELSSAEAVQFFNANHLEGYSTSKVSFGLIYDNQIVAALALRKPFHKKYSSYLEVSRSATLPDISIPGWLGKLSSAAHKWTQSNGNYSLMTYVDSRVGLGSGYSKAGWKQIQNKSTPRFWWTDSYQRWNRFKFRADSENGLTEKQVTEAAGVVKIWGCANSLWEYKPQNIH